MGYKLCRYAHGALQIRLRGGHGAGRSLQVLDALGQGPPVQRQKRTQ